MKIQINTMNSIKLVSFVCILNLVVAISESAPAMTSESSSLAAENVEISKIQPNQPVVAPVIEAAAAISTGQTPTGAKLKRDSRAKLTSLELDTQETGHYLPGAYQAQDSDYGYDAGKNSYGKQASDWSLYDQG